MSKTERYSGLGKWAASVLSSNPDALSEVPDGEFRLREIDIDAVQEFVKMLTDTRALTVDTIVEDGCRISLYELTPAATARRDEILSGRYTPLPCDHGGLHNIDGYEFECKWDACNEVFARGQISL